MTDDGVEVEWPVTRNACHEDRSGISAREQRAGERKVQNTGHHDSENKPLPRLEWKRIRCTWNLCTVDGDRRFTSFDRIDLMVTMQGGTDSRRGRHSEGRAKPERI